MTSAHFIYIPLVVLVGFVLGFIFGGRAARDQFALQKKKEEERAAKRAAKKKASEGVSEPS